MPHEASRAQGQRRRCPAGCPTCRPGAPQLGNPPLERRLPRPPRRVPFGPPRAARVAHQEPPELRPRRPLSRTLLTRRSLNFATPHLVASIKPPRLSPQDGPVHPHDRGFRRQTRKERRIRGEDRAGIPAQEGDPRLELLPATGVEARPGLPRAPRGKNTSAQTARIGSA